MLSSGFKSWHLLTDTIALRQRLTRACSGVRESVFAVIRMLRRAPADRIVGRFVLCSRKVLSYIGSMSEATLLEEND